MRVSPNLFIVSVVLPLEQVLSCPDDQCRIIAFPSTLFFVGERLVNHTIANISVIERDTCEYRCYLNHKCVSINFYFGQNEAETHNCEMNNATATEYDNDLVKAANYVYHGTKNFCAGSPCKNKATCQSGFTSKRYRCLCTSGFTGQDCEKDIDECAMKTHSCSKNNAICANTVGSFKCSCSPGFTGDGHKCTDADECNTSFRACGENAVCENTLGSYRCYCKTGFSGDGHNCTDIDECASDAHFCHVSASCINTEGSFICSCNQLYLGDGRSCISLPSECQSYQSLTGVDRRINYTNQAGTICDDELKGWYRFEGAAGTRMPTSCPPKQRCNSRAPGWLNGTHPTVTDGQVNRTVCFHFFSNCCIWSNLINVTNCGDYYVYYINSTPRCSLRYCSTD